MLFDSFVLLWIVHFIDDSHNSDAAAALRPLGFQSTRCALRIMEWRAVNPPVQTRALRPSHGNLTI
jgi:hypothetical protein